MKRLISMLVLTVLLSLGMTTAVFAAGETISVASVDAKAGETVKVPVVLSGNTGEGFDNYTMTLNYNTDVLELTEISGTYVTAPNTANGMVSYAGANNITDQEVTLFTATFKVKETAEEGTYAVGVTVNTMGVSWPSYVMNPSVNSGSVKVSVPHVCTPADVAGKDATCTANGVKAHQECECGKLYIDGKEVSADDLVIKAAGHTWKWVVDKAATETADGLKHQECSVCGEKKEAVKIPATGTATDDTPVVTPTPGTATDDTTTTTNTDLDDVPKTGDTAVSGIMTAVCAIALFGAAVILVQRKRVSAK